jgi:hypothetical protein
MHVGLVFCFYPVSPPHGIATVGLSFCLVAMSRQKPLGQNCAHQDLLMPVVAITKPQKLRCWQNLHAFRQHPMRLVDSTAHPAFVGVRTLEPSALQTHPLTALGKISLPILVRKEASNPVTKTAHASVFYTVCWRAAVQQTESVAF